jgi:hypothetical protein
MALAGLLVWVAGLCLVPVQETDLFFRLAAGEQFLRTGAIVHANLFSFTYPDAPYPDSAWLFDAAAAALARMGGFPALVLGKTLLVLAIFLLAYRLCRLRGASALATTVVLATAALVMRERLVERPHLFSLLGEVALLGALPLIQRGSRWVWLLVPMVSLWANWHAGAFIAPVLLGVAGVGAALDRHLQAPAHRLPVRSLARYFTLALLSAVALVATPVGIGIVRYLAFHVGIFAIHPVDEFRSLTWRSDAPFVLFALAVLPVLALSTRDHWRDRLPALALAVLATRHVRFAADAILMLAIVAAPALADLLDRFPITRSPRLVGGCAVALFTLAVLPRTVDAGRGGRFATISLDTNALPVDAIQFVDQHGLRERMYNDFETGSYLIWQGYPRYRVFVDPRLPAYPLPFHRLLGRMDVTRDEWTQAMDSLGVDTALLDYAGINRRAAFWDPERWALVFRAKDSRVFVRRLPKWQDLIAALEIPATFDFTVENGAITRPLPAPPQTSPVPACEWQLRLGDLCFELDNGKSERAMAAYRAALAAPAGCLAPSRESSAAAWMGALDVAAHRFDQAIPLLDRALALTPDDTALLTQRALALEALGRSSEASETWKRIAHLAPGTALGQKAAAKNR